MTKVLDLLQPWQLRVLIPSLEHGLLVLIELMTENAIISMWCQVDGNGVEHWHTLSIRRRASWKRQIFIIITLVLLCHYNCCNQCSKLSHKTRWACRNNKMHQCLFFTAPYTDIFYITSIRITIPVSDHLVMNNFMYNL